MCFVTNASAQASLYPNNENLRSDTFDILKTIINLEIKPWQPLPLPAMRNCALLLNQTTARLSGSIYLKWLLTP